MSRKNCIIAGVLFLTFLAVACGSSPEPPRLVPDDYPPNSTPFDLINLPEAWYYMQDKWESETDYGQKWPWVAVVDSGFLMHEDYPNPRRITWGPGIGAVRSSDYIISTSEGDGVGFDDTIGQALFSIDSQYARFVSELDAGTLSSALREEIRSNDVTLSDQATLIVLEDGNVWKIVDPSMEYMIKSENQKLFVYLIVKKPIPCPGTHGTISATLLGGITDNADDFRNELNTASVAGPWLDNNGEYKWGVEIIPIRVHGFLTRCANPLSIYNALKWLGSEDPNSIGYAGGGNSVRVVNLSLGLLEGEGFDRSTEWVEPLEALRWSPGATVVIAAGNDGRTIDDEGWLEGLDHVVLVGAVNNNGTDYLGLDGGISNRGKAVDIYAPGGPFVVLSHADDTGKDPETGRDLDDKKGTSFAAPLVSGVLAMMWNVRPGLSPEEYVSILLDTAQEKTIRGETILILDAYAAVKGTAEYNRPDPVPSTRSD